MALACLVVSVCGLPSYPQPEKKTPPVAILVDEREGPGADGTYKFKFEGANGVRRQEEGQPEGESGAVASKGKWG